MTDQSPYRDFDVEFPRPPENQKIYRNRVECLECGKIIESTHRHDYRTCGCSNQAMVDGGTDYVRSGAKDLTKIRHLTEYVEEDVFLWGVLDRETGYHTKKRLDELDDSHIQNIVLHLRVRHALNPDADAGADSAYLQLKEMRHEGDLKLIEKHFGPELEKRGLEEVDEEVAW